MRVFRNLYAWGLRSNGWTKALTRPSVMYAIPQLAVGLVTLFSSLPGCDATIYESLSALSRAPKIYDFIIVGGGVGGSVVANRLSENPRTSVLLVEAGENDDGVLNITVPGLFPQIDSSRFNWNYQTTPQVGLDNRTIVYSRGKVLGGSSSINAMIFTRGSMDDYDLWGKASGNPARWSWKALLPWMRKYERWTTPSSGRNITGQYDPRAHGRDGVLSTSLSSGSISAIDELALKAAQELKRQGYEYNLEPNDGNAIGTTWAQWTIGGGERSSAATAYLTRDVRSRPNLDIVLNTSAKRLLPAEGGGSLDTRAVELGTAADGASFTFIATKEVILAAGTIGTPHILLNSGIGDANELREVGVPPLLNAPHVGKGMSEHVSVLLSWTRSVSDPPLDSVSAMNEWQLNRTGPYAEAVAAHQIVFKKFERKSSVFEISQNPASGPTSPNVEIVILPSLGNVNARIVLLTPQSRGSVKLRSSNPFDPPLVDLGFYTHPFDIAAMREAIRDTIRFFNASAFTSTPAIGKPYITGFNGPDPDVLSEEEFNSRLRLMSNPYWHVVGTASMARNGGVVDAELKLKGAQGLRIVDASVIPYVPTAHTQAAVYTVAERASAMIRDHWKL